MQTPTKCSEDVVSLTDMKCDPSRVVSHAHKTHRPVILTEKGRGVAIVQAIKDYESETEERAFLRGVVQGVLDLEEGRELDLDTVKKRLGLS
jgi:prevent-host-death family protein